MQRIALVRLTQCKAPRALLINSRPYVSKSSRESSVSELSADSDAPHNSLSTFLAHASRTGLSRRSTVFNGTYYEYVCLEALSKIGFKLSRIGGRNDAGIDLFGTWHIPSQDHPVKCIVQCKALGKKLGPNLVREVEGAFAGAPFGWNNEETIGVLCSTKPATKGVRDAIQKSGRCIMWVMVEGKGESEGKLRQAIWNYHVADIGAEGVGVGIVYKEEKPNDEAENEAEIRLTWKGEVWTPP